MKQVQADICLAYALSLKMEVKCSSEILVDLALYPGENSSFLKLSYYLNM